MRVLVIGGGASGLMAAIHAARAGAEVTILESMEKPGKKLLATGNGRCNLTNQSAGDARYYRSSEKRGKRSGSLCGRRKCIEAIHIEAGRDDCRRTGDYSERLSH